MFLSLMFSSSKNIPVSQSYPSIIIFIDLKSFTSTSNFCFPYYFLFKIISTFIIGI